LPHSKVGIAKYVCFCGDGRYGTVHGCGQHGDRFCNCIETIINYF
jgi:hypothetical protein